MASDNFNLAFQNLANKQLPSAVSDSRALIGEIMRRDRRRTRILAGLSLFFWLIGSVGMLLLVLGLDRLVIFIRISDPSVKLSNTTQSTLHLSSTDQAELAWGTGLIHHALPYIEGSLVAWVLAAAFTIMLIFSSRKAAMNRIDYSLARISEQLVLMRRNGNGAPLHDTNDSMR